MATVVPVTRLTRSRAYCVTLTPARATPHVTKAMVPQEEVATPDAAWKSSKPCVTTAVTAPLVNGDVGCCCCCCCSPSALLLPLLLPLLPPLLLRRLRLLRLLLLPPKSTRTSGASPFAMYVGR